MNYFSPQRPQINYRAAYISKSGKPIAPLPSVTVHPLPDSEDVELGMFLLNGRMSASWYSIDIPTNSIPAYMMEWVEDPEAFMAKHFHYSYEPNVIHLQIMRRLPSSAPDRPIVTLKDLGL